MTDAFTFGLVCFSSLLTILDPLAAAPVFVGLTEGMDPAARRRLAFRACLISLVLLGLFAAFGGFILKAFGITLSALRIAGGVLFVAMGMQMLLGLQTHGSDAEESHGADLAVVPLAMPLICGPGAITTAMLLAGQAQSWTARAAFAGALVAVLVVMAATLAVAPRAMRLLGRSGTEVITRVMALILTALGVQFVLDGLRPVVLELLNAMRP